VTAFCCYLGANSQLWWVLCHNAAAPGLEALMRIHTESMKWNILL